MDWGFRKMTQITQTEIYAIEELRSLFEMQISYCDEILKNKFFPEKASSEIDYIFRDTKSEDTNRLFSLLSNLYERTQKELKN